MIKNIIITPKLRTINMYNISYKNALMSGCIGLIIGTAITLLINWGATFDSIKGLYIAVGSASFCAAFGGNISGQKYN